MRPVGSVERLAALWNRETGPAWRWAAIAIIVAGWVAAGLVGRLGYDWSRAFAAAIVLAAILPAVLGAFAVRRRRRDPRAVVESTVMRTEPEVAKAALRAMALAEQTEADRRRGSSELAQLHFARALGRASLGRLTRHAASVAWVATAVAVGTSAVVVGLVLLDPFRVLEGFNVLAAREGVAPIAVRWTDGARISAEPPAYLDQRRRTLRPWLPSRLPVGTQLTIVADAVHAGRALVLTDGEREAEFVDDGDGAVVSRWTVDDDATLWVAARFGDVLVREARPLEIHAIYDHAPTVRVADAPMTHRLLDHPKVPVHWEAYDDHGLREVALVLRAGDEEIRRELSKPSGSRAVDRGGIELHADDPFLEDSHLPVEATIEALDNDPIGGPKWGRSASLVLLPPQIAEREALRFAALKAARGELTDHLARRITDETPADAAWASREVEGHAAIRTAFQEVLDGDWGGLRFRGRLAALIRGQLERLDRATEAVLDFPSAVARKKLLEQTEGALLAIDSALGALGYSDTRSASLELADVADAAAATIATSREPSERERAEQLLRAHLFVLEAGGGFLVDLGRLGEDLGEIVENGIRRIRRPLGAGDRYHARLAAEDLAARLRRPDPSFGSSGGGQGGEAGPGGEGGPGGVEAGGSQGGGEGEASQAAEQVAGLEEALEQLRQEHAQQMGEVEQALRDALPAEERQKLAEKLRDAAKKVREAVKNLPEQASDPGSARAAAAKARSQAESMAGAMERGELAEAIRRGEEAMGSLKQSERLGQQARPGSADRRAGEAAREARDKLQPLMDQGQSTLEEMRDQASNRAGGKLRRAAEHESKLAERARKLGEQSRDSEAPLPKDMLERLDDAARRMEQAAREFEQGRGAEGRDEQQEAQRLLEMAQPESESQDGKGDQDGDGDEYAHDADVPPEARDQRADEFRKRVTEGLRDAPPHLREALRRYTEGLLR